jgi:hypothetical protein
MNHSRRCHRFPSGCWRNIAITPTTGLVLESPNVKSFPAMDAPRPRREVLFEGLREDEILNLPNETVEQLVLLGEPIVFRVGSAMLLGSFKLKADRLVVELAQIEGGGDGALPSLASLTRRYATQHGLSGVEWIVHAVSCARPNLKLRRVLERRGFVVEQVAGVGEAYHFIDAFPPGSE